LANNRRFCDKKEIVVANEEKDLLALSVRDFASATADRTPTPGGGSVAGVVAAMAAALAEMSLKFTQGKKKFAEHEQYYSHLLPRLERARKMFEQLVHDDVAAYTLYQQSTRLADGPEKDQAVAIATAAAIDVPRELAKTALALLEDLESFAGRCSQMLISDLAAAGALAAACVRLCDYNVRVNTPHLSDRRAAVEINQASREDVRRASRMLEMLELAIAGIMP